MVTCFPRHNEVMAALAVTGSTGELGGRVARRLAERGIEQRVVVSDPARAPKLAGAEVAVASSYGAEEEMRAALAGARTLYFVSGREDADRIEQHLTLVRAAKSAGIERIVYTSFVGAAPDATFTLVRHHWATEQAIRDAGLAFTFMRSSLYLDFMPFFAGPERIIRGPAGEGRFAAVSRDDLADAHAAVLADPERHAGKTYELTGSELLTMTEVAARLTAYTGIEFGFVNESLEQAWESRRPSGAPDWMIEGWVTTYVAIADGSLAVRTDAVEALTGHRPHRLEECLDAHPELLAAIRPES
jgi:NAD(P)H dehydrogenase (quinone)